MKKMFLFIIFITLMFIMASCKLQGGENVHDDHIKCDNLMTDLVSKLNGKDAQSAKTFFSSRLYEMETFDSDLNDLIDYYSGELIELNGMVTTGEYSNNYYEKHHELEYAVVCDNDIFRFRLFYVEKDSRDSKNVGINYLYVLKKSEDEYPDLRYFGGLYPKDGIHVAYPHELPVE